MRHTWAILSSALLLINSKTRLGIWTARFKYRPLMRKFTKEHSVFTPYFAFYLNVDVSIKKKKSLTVLTLWLTSKHERKWLCFMCQKWKSGLSRL